MRHEFVELQRPVCPSRWAGGNRSPPARSCASASPSYMPPICGIGGVALVHDEHEILRKEVQQRVGSRVRRPAAQMARVVLDTRAKTHFLEHLQVVLRAHLEPLGLEQFSLGLELGDPQVQLLRGWSSGRGAASRKGVTNCFAGKRVRPRHGFSPPCRSADRKWLRRSISSPKNSIADAQFVLVGGAYTSITSPRTRNLPRVKAISLRLVEHVHELGRGTIPGSSADRPKAASAWRDSPPANRGHRCS